MRSDFGHGAMSYSGLQLGCLREQIIKILIENERLDVDLSQSVTKSRSRGIASGMCDRKQI